MTAPADQAARTALEAARWAPSVHNTQPWSFAVAGEEISVRADPDRKLRLGDPGGREVLISCGAAVFNMTTALRDAGREPIVRILPDPDRPSLLATVRLGPAAEPGEDTRTLAREIERRHTHRAGFADAVVPEQVTAAWERDAMAEGATLMIFRTPEAVRGLAGLTEAAQAVQAQDRPYALEVFRWGRAPGSRRDDGVPAGTYPNEPEGEFAQRDYARGEDWGAEESPFTGSGLVALLTTREDTREAWLAAGQALEHVLLHASANGISAAFHTQALEEPHLRDFLRERVCGGAHPQMLMRLGVAPEEGRRVRRPLTDLLGP
ncbi:Acg family FMN-binding oxidoreductase [Nonomuraea longicatena]|uniref:Nitroreductase family protein n=1 Tax=Nonomuraea longicatena TaxID=83682 RepID=A0ABN1PDP1_9ACTN